MKRSDNDPKPGSQKITNQDEEDVAVNRSTSPEGGYDQPITEKSEPRVEKTGKSEDKDSKAKRRTRSSPGEDIQQ